MKTVTTVLAATFLVCAISEARPVRPWSPKELYDRSDAVVLASPLTIEKTTEIGEIQLGGNPPLPVVTYKVQLMVRYAIKGEDLKRIEFRYSALDDQRMDEKPVVNGPGRIWLQQDAMYVFYLKKVKEDGRVFFVNALEGEFDDNQAVVLIAPRSTGYSDFASLPDPEKNQLTWSLFHRNEFGKAEHKPICRELLATQGQFAHANAVSFTIRAIAVAEKHGWRDLAGHIRAIYDAPNSFWTYKAAFDYLRRLESQPVPEEVVAHYEILNKADWYRSTISDSELRAAKERLIVHPDHEAVLIYAIEAACSAGPKGGGRRGQRAAVEVIRSLDKTLVTRALGSLKTYGLDVGRFNGDLEWVIAEVGIDLGQ